MGNKNSDKKCWWIFFHKWGKWADVILTSTTGIKYLGQKRYCEKCNKKESRTVTIG